MLLSQITTECQAISQCNLLKTSVKVDYNNKVIYSRYHLKDIDIFSEEVKDQRHPGVYLETGRDANNKLYCYSGKSENSLKEGVYKRLKDHETESYKPQNKSKPKYANRRWLSDVFTILNLDERSTLPLNGDVIPTLEHIFYIIMKCACPEGNLNTESNTIFKFGDDGRDLFRYIYPIVNGVINSAEEDLAFILNTLPTSVDYNKNFQKLSVNTDVCTSVYKLEDVIHKGSYFEINERSIKYNSYYREMLSNMINAGVCIPYCISNRSVILFVEDLDLNKNITVRASSRSIPINKDELDNLMGCRQRQKTWINA